LPNTLLEQKRDRELEHDRPKQLGNRGSGSAWHIHSGDRQAVDRAAGRRSKEVSDLKTSAVVRGLGRSTISAELRSHEVSQTPVIVLQNVELCLAVAGNDQGLAIRTGAGQRQGTKPSTWAIWLSPLGVGDNQITIKAPIPRTLHLHLSAALFGRLADDLNLPGAPAQSIRYIAGVRDEIIIRIGLSILSAMTNETAAGRMFVETASATLAARLLQTCSDSGTSRSLKPTARRLDQARLQRQPSNRRGAGTADHPCFSFVASLNRPGDAATAFHKNCLNFGELVANSNGGETFMIRQAITPIGILFVVGTISTAALAVSKRTATTAEGEQLVHMLDKDHNGVVSRDEFMQFMGQRFDRFDVNKNGTLEPKELQRTAIPRVVLRDCVHRAFPANE
jgi:hypothetical protein